MTSPIDLPISIVSEIIKNNLGKKEHDINIQFNINKNFYLKL